MIFLIAGHYFEARNYADDELMARDEWCYIVRHDGDAPSGVFVNLASAGEAIALHEPGDSVRCVGTFENGGRYTYEALAMLQRAGVEIEPHPQMQARIDHWAPLKVEDTDIWS